MFTRSLNEETPELAPLSIKHTELESDTHESLHCFETVILVCLRDIMWQHALQRVERSAIVFARLINRPHDALIAVDECVDVHLRDEVHSRDGVVTGSVRAEQSSFSFESLPQLRIGKCIQHSHHRHRNCAFANEVNLPFEDVVRIVIKTHNESGHHFHAVTLNPPY